MKQYEEQIMNEFDEYWGEIDGYGSAKYFSREKAKQFIHTALQKALNEGTRIEREGWHSNEKSISRDDVVKMCEEMKHPTGQHYPEDFEQGWNHALDDLISKIREV